MFQKEIIGHVSGQNHFNKYEHRHIAYPVHTKKRQRRSAAQNFSPPSLSFLTDAITKLIATSKKIQKQRTNDPLGRRNNHKKMNKLPKRAIYYEVLHFNSQNKKKCHSFYCYRDKDLKFPTLTTEKTIKQVCDNDCPSDEGIISNNIQMMYTRLINEIEKEESDQS